jgi:hypothetical protein
MAKWMGSIFFLILFSFLETRINEKHKEPENKTIQGIIINMQFRIAIFSYTATE